MGGEALKGHLDLLLLAIVEDEPAYGYAIIEALRARSGGHFDLPEGTVYPALHRLERGGLLASAWAEGTPRPRRVYALTAAGRQRLAAGRREWRGFSAAIGSV